MLPTLRVLLLAIASAAAGPAAAEPAALPSLGAPEAVSEGHLGLEGPVAWPGESGRGAGVLFADVSAGKILFYDRDSGQTRVVDPASGGANGLALAGGELYRCEGKNRRVAATELAAGEDGTPRLGATRPAAVAVPGGRPFFTNDLIAAGNGLFFTDPVYGPRPGGGPAVEGVYAIPLPAASPPAEATLVVGDLVRPNGVAVDPAGVGLYVADEGARKIHRYTVVPAAGGAAPGLVGPSLFADVAAFGNPDGMTTDRAGRLYVALFETGRLLVLSPDGEPLAIADAGERTSNVCLGHDQRHAYVTAGGTLLRFGLDVDRPADEAPIRAGARPPAGG
ncbi:SMP-30/gluconolactonase/LRE family protein [Phycisphaera mikurensis]|uniref:Putative gluconolactonase n=1 Tax=Phycisphaera mikurensis (strain NBRC 102666 / KCTC 22515 / FYK2301M01) TaxID=1142394 RepID=I0IJ02_PHYMF|nr:SMP-30/gluconolactonase/LRE family protein [Phycisphaera mikurensis]MBB6443087.1 gluconolactonase [Phycisphaera mikurensis]BAM05240.1 putative gluconolactonase [Phycisphaera mikurensis NBRC 102666]